jgi:hypothetical protein
MGRPAVRRGIGSFCILQQLFLLFHPGGSTCQAHPESRLNASRSAIIQHTESPIYLEIEVVGNSRAFVKHILRLLHLSLRTEHSSKLVKREWGDVGVVLQLSLQIDGALQRSDAVGKESKATECCTPQQQGDCAFVVAFSSRKRRVGCLNFGLERCNLQ